MALRMGVGGRSPAVALGRVSHTGWVARHQCDGAVAGTAPQTQTA